MSKQTRPSGNAALTLLMWLFTALLSACGEERPNQSDEVTPGPTAGAAAATAQAMGCMGGSCGAAGAGGAGPLAGAAAETPTDEFRGPTESDPQPIVGNAGERAVDETSNETASDTSGAGRGLPCQVEEIVHRRCTSCHSDPPVGTYMPLLTHAHFHEPSTTDPERAYWELAAERIVAADNPMPPVTAEPLTDDERSALSAWFEQGAPLSAEDCGDAPATMGHDTDDPADIDTTGLQCHRFLAHAPGDKQSKFQLGVAVDAYYNMVFQAPWQSQVYGLVVKPVIDNATVLHHWLLYYEPGAGVDGDVGASSGQHSGGELVHGWAPGGAALDFRRYGDVGFELQPGMYLMEFHYNSDDPAAEDASGVEVCFQTEVPENVAGLHWLGLDWGPESYITGALLGTATSGACLEPRDEWVGVCDPVSEEPIHLMFVVPHMHEAGVRMTGVINGPNGSRVLHDAPFDFSAQVAYEVNEILMPGETITTTCQFSEPKCSGQATGAEMCYLYTYGYPKGALVDNMPWGALAHGEGTCLGQ